MDRIPSQPVTNRFMDRCKTVWRRCGFTLVEIMVAIVVLTLILAVLLQILTVMLHTTQFSNRKMDASQRARAALDTLGDDLAHLVTASSLTVLARHENNDNSGNIRFAFLTQGRGPVGATSTRLIAVEYHLSGGDLIRSLTPVPWTATNFVDELTRSAAEANTSTTQSSVVASGVLRMDVVAVMDDGSTLPLTSSAAWWPVTLNGETLPYGFRALTQASSLVDPANPKVRAIIVAVATLDEGSYGLPKASIMGTSLDAPVTGHTPVETWNGDLATPVFLSSYPKPAIAVLNIAQNVYQLK